MKFSVTTYFIKAVRIYRANVYSLIKQYNKSDILFNILVRNNLSTNHYFTKSSVTPFMQIILYI